MHRKTAAIVAGVVLLLLVGLVLALPSLVDVNQHRDRIEAELQQRLDRPVSLGQLQLSLWPFGVRVEQATIGDDPAFRTGRPFAQADELYVSLRLWPLLRGTVELRAVELRRPVIELVRNAEGTWNVSTLGGASEAPADPSDADAAPPALILHRLIITNGQVAVTDLAADGRRAIYDNIDLRLDDFAPDRAFDLELSARLPGEGTQRVALRGTAGPLVAGDVAATPFDGTLRAEEASLGALQQFFDLDALEGTDAVVSGNADVRSADGQAASRGSFRLERSRVRGVEIGYPIALDYDLAHDLRTDVLSITSGTLRLDGTPLSLSGTVNLQPETPVLDVHVMAEETALAEAARLASAFGVAFGPDMRVQGTWDADLRVRGPADRPALDGRVRLREVAISGADIPQPVRTPAIDLAFTPEEVRSSEFTAATGSTSVSAQFAVRQYTAETPVVDASIRTGDADLGELLDVARAWGVDAAQGMRGSGRVSVNVRATGPTTDLALSGSGSLRDATLEAPALTEPLRVQTATLGFSQDAAILEQLVASLGGTTFEGRFSVRNFDTPRVDFELAADRIDVVAFQSIFTGDPSGASATARPAQAPAGDSVLLRTTGTGRMRVGSVVYDGLVLTNVASQAALDRGVIRLDPVTADLFGGRHRGAIVLDSRQSPAAVSVVSELAGVDANQLLSATTNVRDVIHGPLGATLDVRFTGEDADAVARSLDGTMSIELTDGRIANMNLRHEIGNIARFITGQAPAERTTQVARLTGTFQVTGGVARTDDLTATIEDGSLSARGSVNLIDESVDLRLMAVLSRDATQRVGGTQIGGLLTTALANQQGELVVPMLVTGSLQQPRFAPDTQLVAEMQLKNLVPSLRNPRDLTSGLLDAIRGRGQEPADPAARPQEAPPQTPRDAVGDAVGDILGGIFGRGRQAQPAPQETEPPPPAPDAPNLDAPSADDEGQTRSATPRSILRDVASRLPVLEGPAR